MTQPNGYTNTAQYVRTARPPTESTDRIVAAEALN